MKLAILFSGVCLLAALPGQAQRTNKHVEVATGYNAGLPQGSMQQHANTVHSAEVQALYLLPKMNRLGIGLQMNTGSYASFTRTQVFGFNGTSTPTEVNYNSNVTTGSLVVKYVLLEKANYNIFANLRGGLTNFKSKLEIEDPEDTDGCHPLETRDLIEDNTWQAASRVGVNLDFHSFAHKIPSGILMIQGYAGYVMGGDVDYINVRNTTTDHNTHAATGDGSTPLNMQFVNVSTNETHDHEVARVYNSPVRFMEAGISLVVRF